MKKFPQTKFAMWNPQNVLLITYTNNAIMPAEMN